jgi:hypothetical protein
VRVIVAFEPTSVEDVRLIGLLPRAKGFADDVVITESQLGGAEVAIAFKPRAEWDTAFRFFRP